RSRRSRSAARPFALRRVDHCQGPGSILELRVAAHAVLVHRDQCHRLARGPARGLDAAGLAAQLVALCRRARIRPRR
ncbi:MAG: hypothetical protein ACK56I_22295, partial [bacterium]